MPDKNDGGYLGRCERKYPTGLVQPTYKKAIALVQKVTGCSEKEAIEYLESERGHHFFGREDDKEFLKSDFAEFKGTLPRLKEMLEIVQEKKKTQRKSDELIRKQNNERERGVSDFL